MVLVALALLLLRAGGVLVLWPALGVAVWWLGRGAPSLSNQPGLEPTTVLAAIAVLPALVRATTPRRLLAVAVAALVPALAVAVICGLDSALRAGPPPRLPGWSGQLSLWAVLSITGLGGGAVTAGLRFLSAHRTPT
jgi:hypothetical protein